MKTLFRYCLVIIFLTIAYGGLFTENASATLRQHQDAPGILRYHSQVSIKDKLGYSWQVLLFRKNKPGETEKINLRLVGFPGIYNFSHPQDLEILTSRGKLLTADDIYAKISPAANVGEYNFTNLVTELLPTPGNQSIELILPLQDQQTITLDISSNLLTEWQWLINDFN
ncbi:MAG: DUF3122 domain-containing protein [Mastigocoleus sp.]|mgnify:CR=1 FL=1